jgi:hypothetical protein
MKKLGLLFFITALIFGVMSAANCSFGRVSFNILGRVNGSGTVKQETRNVADFDEIETSGAINAEVAVGDSFSVSVEADDNILQFIKTEVSGNTLKIHTEGKFSTKSKINVKISMPELRGLDINGASNVTAANVKGDSLNIKVNGASEVKISGEAKELNARANGASTIDAENLKSENTEVDSNGASTVTVSSSNELRADASGASTIYYTGEPKNIMQDASGASSIKKK